MYHFTDDMQDIPQTKWLCLFSQCTVLVYFQPLLDLERNGPNLHYNVWWRRKDAKEEWSNVTTVGSKHVVHNTETYVPYEIKIQARNEFGSGPESNVITGYSGEDSKWMHTGHQLVKANTSIDFWTKADRYFTSGLCLVFWCHSDCFLLAVNQASIFPQKILQVAA